jgi:hypothetical protein
VFTARYELDLCVEQSQVNFRFKELKHSELLSSSVLGPSIFQATFQIRVSHNNRNVSCKCQISDMCLF